MIEGIVHGQRAERDAVKGLLDRPIPPVEQSRDGISAINCSRLITGRAQDIQHARDRNLLGRTARDYTFRLNGLQEHAFCQQRFNQRLQRRELNAHIFGKSGTRDNRVT